MSDHPLFWLVLVLKVYRRPSNVSSIKCRISICCTCYFQSGSPFPLLCLFWLPLQVSSVSNFCPHTRGRRWPLRLTCSVVLWRRRDSANKHHWRVWGVLAVDGPHYVCHSPRQHVLPGSRLISLQGALQGHCAKWALRFMHFPGLSRSGFSGAPQGHRPG